MTIQDQKNLRVLVAHYKAYVADSTYIEHDQNSILLELVATFQQYETNNITFESVSADLDELIGV